jgi:hypothetical protein
MRIALVLAVSLIVLAPAAGSANPKARCEHLNLQIAHFEAQMARADQLDSDLWADRFSDHLDDLKSQRKSCPGYSDSEIAAKQMRELFELAARGAISFFTMGMAPF